jgi:hypothetical protein
VRVTPVLGGLLAGRANARRIGGGERALEHRVERVEVAPELDLAGVVHPRAVRQKM